MRKILLTLLIFCISFPLYAQRPKVALVLSGGGAKGAAHIGVIKVLEEYGIPVDMVIGTSMGALIGGFYAVGYSGKELDSLVMAQDWNNTISGVTSRDQLSYETKQMEDHLLLSVPFQIKEQSMITADSTSLLILENSGQTLPTAVFSGQHIQSILMDLTSGYHSYMNFNDLPIPFACTGADLVTYKEVVFHEGILPQAMRASMSIPGVFAPVQIDDYLLIDGGLRNNFPVDVARSMGADIVIGVNVSGNNEHYQYDYNNPLVIIEAIISLGTHIKTDEAIENTDLHIQPPLGTYGTMSFSTEALRYLIDSGEAAAREKVDELLAIRDALLEVTDGKLEAASFTSGERSKMVRDSLVIGEVIYNGVSEEEIQVLEWISKIKTNNKISRQDIVKMTQEYYATNAFSSVSWVLENDMEPYTLVVNCIKKMSNQVGVNVRADTEEVISALLDIRLNYHTLYGSKFALKARINQNYGLEARYTYETKSVFEIDLSAGIRHYTSKLEDNTSMAYRHHKAGLSFSTGYSKNYKIQLGANVDYFKMTRRISTIATLPDCYLPWNDNGGYFNVVAGLDFDNLDDREFAKRGSLIDASYINSFDWYSFHSAFSALNLKYHQYITIGKNQKTTLIPFVKSRVLLGDKVPLEYANMLGSNEEGKYMDQQISVFGLNKPLLVDKFVGVAGLDVRQQIAENHYVSLGCNYVTWSNSLKRILSENNFVGFRLKYAYQLYIFPMSVNLNWSTYTKKPGFYMSVGCWF